MNIDAKNLILGRLATFCAKQALLGENVNVYNCELAVVSGKKKEIFEKYKRKIQRGDPHHGPYFPKIARNLVRRTIRGMLPHKQARGREAYKRVKCFSGEGKNMETIKNADVTKIMNTSYVSVKEICDSLK